ncbi:MAG: hypothetical protein WD715_10065 [Dongiaceae bacterium]
MLPLLQNGVLVANRHSLGISTEPMREPDRSDSNESRLPAQVAYWKRVKWVDFSSSIGFDCDFVRTVEEGKRFHQRNA